jgi:hypothetical protein
MSSSQRIQNSTIQQATPENIAVESNNIKKKDNVLYLDTNMKKNILLPDNCLHLKQ